MDKLFRYYDRIYCVDFEFGGVGGQHGPNDPRCVVVMELRSGQTTRLWLDGRQDVPCPMRFDDRTLYVAFYASAEIACHHALGWPMPTRVLDLYAELKWCVNGLTLPIESYLKNHKVRKHSLIGALYHFGLHDLAAALDEKDEMRELAMRGGEYTNEERVALLNYNQRDVEALRQLLPRMLPKIRLPGALFRGRYMKAAGLLEYLGIPVDGEMATRLKANWHEVIDRLIRLKRKQIDIIKYREVDQAKFGDWLRRNEIRFWPMTVTGKYKTDQETLTDMGKVFGKTVIDMKEFLLSVRKTRLFEELGIGPDNRNRYLLSPFCSKTGRNQPSSSRCVFGPSTWVRSLIKPAPGMAIAYLDWSGQEYGEAAYFSGDSKMIRDYESGDPYLGFAVRVGIITEAERDEYRRTKPPELKKLRNQLKVALGLGVLYGAGSRTVSRQGEMIPAEAKRYLRLHKRTYQRFWEWRAKVITAAMTRRELRSTLDWHWNVKRGANSRTASNFPMQSGGSDMLRLAICEAVEAGISVVGGLHDALLIEAPIDHIDTAVRQTSQIMKWASTKIMGCGELRVDDDPDEVVVTWPARYYDGRGRDTWNDIIGLLEVVESRK